MYGIKELETNCFYGYEYSTIEAAQETIKNYIKDDNKPGEERAEKVTYLIIDEEKEVVYREV